jgi:hypothetical protein
MFRISRGTIEVSIRRWQVDIRFGIAADNNATVSPAAPDVHKKV